jgi:hypothetical protein
MRCSAEQVLCFCATVLLGGHVLKIDRWCCRGSGDTIGRLRRLGGAGPKIGDIILQAREIMHYIQAGGVDQRPFIDRLAALSAVCLS